MNTFIFKRFFLNTWFYSKKQVLNCFCKRQKILYFMLMSDSHGLFETTNIIIKNYTKNNKERFKVLKQI